MEVDEGGPIWNDVHEIRSAGERAASLTRQLLAFSRKQALTLAVVDPNVIVRDLQKMLQRLIGEDIVIRTQLTPDLRYVKADVSQLEQILVNLVVNARDAMGQGTLTIKTANTEFDDTPTPGVMLPAGRYTMLIVSDTGCGMDEHTKARIFEPFFTTKETGQGTGLGLSTVYGTVTQLGGSVVVDSQPGLGTTFTIYLPHTDECPEPVSTHADASLPVGNEKVLLVEDDEAVRAFATSVLRRGGYSVRDAATPEEALAICTHDDVLIDLVLTDVVMPGMNGKQMVDRLQAHRPHAKVLYMSGFNEHFFGGGGVLNGDDALVQKPFTADALLRSVRQVLDATDASATEPLDRAVLSVQRVSVDTRLAGRAHTLSQVPSATVG